MTTQINKILLLLTLMGLMSMPTNGQSKSSIQVISLSKKNAIWLRWAPSDPLLWKTGNKYGYHIERFTVPKVNLQTYSPTGIYLTHTPLKPLSIAEWESLSQTVEEAEAVKELIFESDTGTPESPTPSQAMAIKRQQENKFGMALFMCDIYPPIAKAAGLFFSDTTVEKGHRYIYRISIAYCPPMMECPPGVITVDADENIKMPTIQGLWAESGDRYVTLQWPTLLLQGAYSAYFIEKSNDGKKFSKISKQPYLNMSTLDNKDHVYYVDSLADNHHDYYYRIAGITPFGETGPYTAPIQVRGKKDLRGLLSLTSAKNNKNEITLSWEFPLTEEHTLEGFLILISPDLQKTFLPVNKKLVNRNKRTYTDIAQAQNVYYQIAGINKSGQKTVLSLPMLVHLEDNKPPEIPNQVTGTIDHQGVAHIQWSANMEKDLLGYRVFRTNDLKNEWMEVTDTLISTPRFTDTLNLQVLNKRINYAIIAVDENYNTSNYSKPLILTRPDIIPPVPPVFIEIESRANGAWISWSNSSSQDLSHSSLVRRTKGAETETPILQWIGQDKFEYIDEGAEPGDHYYLLIAMDSAGNKSIARTQLIHIEPGSRPGVNIVLATAQRENQQITIQWKNESQAVRHLVYRSKNGGQFTLYKTLEGNQDTLLDRNIFINNTYAYKIQSIFPSGVRTELSKEAMVKF